MNDEHERTDIMMKFVSFELRFALIFVQTEITNFFSYPGLNKS